jgi:hypothetical protein
MTLQADTRSIKAETLKVFQVDEGQYYVESSEGKVCYRVSLNGTKTCACGDFAIHAPKDPAFVCKHIIAVTNGNGNVIPLFEPHKIRLDERFIKQIKGKDFVLYPGVLDLGHQEGIKKLEVEAIQLPTKENGQNAICKVVLETLDGKVYTDYGDANPLNVNKEVAGHILRVASTRAKARVLRDATNVGMTCLEELGDFDDVGGDTRPGNNGQETSAQKTSRKEVKAPEPKKDTAKETKVPGTDEKGKTEGAQGPKKETTADPKKITDISSKEKVPEPKSEGDKPTISIAQKNAIDNLAKRRGFSPESVKEMATKQFGKDLDTITTAEASQFIRHLQQAA